MPGKIKAVHHTLADWDFQTGATNRSLADDFYISAPTSLKYSGAVGDFGCVILCRVPATLCVAQGELRNWIRKSAIVYWIATFRNQAALGTADFENCYGISLYGGTATLRRMLFGAGTTRDTTTCYMAFNEWIHYRVSWYNGFTPGEVPALCVDIYREIAGEWSKEGDTLYDTSYMWWDSEINRCGIRPVLGVGLSEWNDDTEIWGPLA